MPIFMQPEIKNTLPDTCFSYQGERVKTKNGRFSDIF
jgi:hypothetical protein